MDLFVSNNNDNTIHEGGLRMKRFLGILVASMFLASAAYAADAMKEEKKADAKASEKKAEGKAKGEEKKADSKAKAGDEKKADEKKSTK